MGQSLLDCHQKPLDFLQMLVFEGQKLSREQMLPFLMSAMKKGQAHNVSFDEKETDAIITVLRKYASPEEIDKINKLMSLKRK